MIGFIVPCLLLCILSVCANPLPDVRRDLENEAVATTIVTVTATLYATLIPPTLPVVTVQATYTESVYTSTSTFSSLLNCTTTLYSAIAAPESTTVLSNVTPATSAVRPTALVELPEELQERQLPTSPSLTPVSTPVSTPASTPVSTSSETTVATTTSEPAITASIFSTVTSTLSQTQRPAYTRTNYIIQTTTPTVPLVRTAYACAATLQVFYSIATDVVTSTYARTVYPSTTTLTSLVECAARPTIPVSVIPPPPPAPSTSVAATKAPFLMDRQAAGSTILFSTTATQTRVQYLLTTVTAADPSTRMVRACSPTAPAVTPSVSPTASM
ncbi:hypothetical protein EG329_000700 [Mollisiaceae sp. DMI_Dod_QoI]|nr:hypothetical protein EG329_000700 [Helotiales sp. DMI_Dod_QoI]